MDAAFANFQQVTAATQPSFLQHEPIPGQAELYALQQGAFGIGMGMDNMYDQNQWETMLTEMGPPTSHVRSNGGSFAGPSTA